MVFYYLNAILILNTVIILIRNILTFRTQRVVIDVLDIFLKWLCDFISRWTCI